MAAEQGPLIRSTNFEHYFKFYMILIFNYLCAAKGFLPLGVG